MRYFLDRPLYLTPYPVPAPFRLGLLLRTALFRFASGSTPCGPTAGDVCPFCITGRKSEKSTWWNGQRQLLFMRHFYCARSVPWRSEGYLGCLRFARYILLCNSTRKKFLFSNRKYKLFPIPIPPYYIYFFHTKEIIYSRMKKPLLRYYGSQGKLGRSAHVTPATKYAQLEKIRFSSLHNVAPTLPAVPKMFKFAIMAKLSRYPRLPPSPRCTPRGRAPRTPRIPRVA